MNLFNDFIKPKKAHTPYADTVTGMDPYTLAYFIKNRFILSESEMNSAKPVKVPPQYQSDQAQDKDEKKRIQISKSKLRKDEESEDEKDEESEETDLDDKDDVAENIKIVLAKLRMKPDEETKRKLVKRLAYLRKQYPSQK